MTYSFEKLKVWQKSRSFVKQVYVTTKSFPAEEKFGLTSQIRRAAVSISSNIAEGSSRQSQKEKGRFYEIAFGSLIEVLNQFLIAEDLGFIKSPEIKEYRKSIAELSRMLNALYQATKK
jgi:four helix bundle protein